MRDVTTEQVEPVRSSKLTATHRGETIVRHVGRKDLIECLFRKSLNRDLDIRATKTIEQARKMPLGQQRSDALKEAGRLRIAAEMNRWLSTK
jgi:hypothetical protein